jgi:ABC-type glutathione transport system ATPase component
VSPLLEVSGLTVDYHTKEAGRKKLVRVIDGLDLQVERGEVFGVVGESGSGKSTLAGAVLGLVDRVGGSITFDGTELIGLSGRARKSMRPQMQMVFQNPLLSLSPRRAVGWQLEEPLRVHTSLDRAQRNDAVDKLLADLDLSPAIKERFPHELSGGQAQRVVLARALTLKPSLIVFDEPTSALDVSVQAGVLNLLHRIKREQQLTYVFITHDLGVVRHLADRIAVMRTGAIVELRPTEELFTDPQHDYTKELLASSLSISDGS